MHRQCGQISEGQAPLVGLELLSRGPEELGIEFRAAANHHNILCQRMEAESEFQRRRKFPRDKNAANVS